MEKVFEIYIKTTPERLWEAITDTEMRASTRSASASAPTGRTAASYTSVHPSAGIRISEGENLEVDPPRRLVQSFTALWSDEVKAAGTSRVTWDIEPVGDSCRLTVTHDELPEHVNNEIYGGGRRSSPASRRCWRRAICSPRRAPCAIPARRRMPGELDQSRTPHERAWRARRA